MNERKEK